MLYLNTLSGQLKHVSFYIVFLFLGIFLLYQAIVVFYDLESSYAHGTTTSTNVTITSLRSHGGSQCLPDFTASSLIQEADITRKSCETLYSYRPSNIRIGTVTAHFGDPQPQYQKALQTHLMHNLVHGTQLDVLCSTIIDAIWNKPAFILSLLLEEMAKPAQERLEWLFWVDRDTFILDPCRPVSGFLPPEIHRQRSDAKTKKQKDLHMIVSKDWNGLNAGVFLVRVDRWAIDFFSDLLAFRHFQPNVSLPFEEQSAMEMLIDQPRFYKGVEQVPSVWFNAYPGDSPTEFAQRKTDEGLEYYNARRGDFLVHFAGVENKNQIIYEWADMLESQKGVWQPEQTLRNITTSIEATWHKRYHG
ncbi:hypothetical protein FSARC_9752 [Fusarium sarcochroum]|uniref:Galactosyl transferase GMA12/MNN10 family protein n=1 Tax=Fusarium sarcochroum TaxID=1208366 RepID=A0A8H4X523_9HYPO|nr:hypothetical protein FSARC_9752 [Fusarium sarcochroum]